MRSPSYIGLFFIALIALPSAVWGTSVADAPEIFARVDASAVVLGKRFVLRVAVTHPTSTTVDLPRSLVLGNAFEEIARQKQQAVQKDGRTRTEFVLTLLPFELGKQDIPEIPVTYVQHGGRVSEIKTAVVHVVVASIRSGPPRTDQLRAIAPPVAVQRDDWTLLYVLGSVVGLLLFVWLIAKIRRLILRWKARGRDQAPVQPLLPEDEEALAKLTALAGSGALDADDLKPAYYAMSDILRVYLGRRYSFPAIDSTTEEIRQQIGMAAGGAWIIAAAVLNWLENADLVKFANAPALPADAHKACAAVRDIVAQTRRSLEQHAEAPGADKSDKEEPIAEA
jgi:hypothetical protein